MQKNLYSFVYCTVKKSVQKLNKKSKELLQIWCIKMTNECYLWFKITCDNNKTEFTRISDTILFLKIVRFYRQLTR